MIYKTHIHKQINPSEKIDENRQSRSIATFGIENINKIQLFMVSALHEVKTTLLLTTDNGIISPAG